MLGLDDDGNIMKVNRYNYFIQAKKIFESMQNLSVNFGYNFEVAKIISFHIILPSESPSSIPIGEDEGYRTETDEDGNVQLKFCQMFQSTYQIMITSDNVNEVNLVYHIYKSLMIALVPHLTLKGLLNPKLSGNDVVFQDDQMPMGIFHKVLNLTFDYELVVPQLLLAGLMKTIAFEGTGYAPSGAGSSSFDDGTKKDDTGKTADDYTARIVDKGRPIEYNEKAESQDGIPSHYVEPSGSSLSVDETSSDYPSKRVEPAGNVENSSMENYPSKRVEVGRQAFNDGREFPTTHIINSLYGENNTLNGVRIAVTDGSDVLLSGVAVQIKSENYLYYGITDANGVATFSAIANEVYDITLAISGKNQGEYKDIRFDSLEVYLRYSLVEKSIWDGMHSDTAPILYVDIHDGGKA